MTVAMFLAYNGIIPPVEDKDTMEEERRLFYVAITRAKERLYILSSKKRIVNGKFKEFQASPFIKEINEETINRN